MKLFAKPTNQKWEPELYWLAKGNGLCAIYCAITHGKIPLDNQFILLHVFKDHFHFNSYSPRFSLKTTMSHRTAPDGPRSRPSSKLELKKLTFIRAYVRPASPQWGSNLHNKAKIIENDERSTKIVKTSSSRIKALSKHHNMASPHL